MAIYKNRKFPITRVLPKGDQSKFNEEPVVITTAIEEDKKDNEEKVEKKKFK